MSGLAPGQYQVRLPDAAGGFSAPEEMDLSGSQELDSASARSMSTIKVKVRMRDGSKLPEHFFLALRSSKAVQRVNWQNASRTGEVGFYDVVPGRYDLLAATNDRGYGVVAISSGDEPSTGKTLDVPAGAALEISASVVGGMSNVEGLAKHEGKAAPGAMIVLVPENPENNREFFRRDQSDLDGTFTLLNVIPGKYKVVAIDDGWDLDWAKPEVMAPYLKKSEPITVGDQVHGAIHLSHALEVQKK